VDVGTLDQFEMTARSVCPPKILLFDLKNGDKIISEFTNYYLDNVQIRFTLLFLTRYRKVRVPKVASERPFVIHQHRGGRQRS